jgi:hypothetical protein
MIATISFIHDGWHQPWPLGVGMPNGAKVERLGLYLAPVLPRPD